MKRKRGGSGTCELWTHTRLHVFPEQMQTPSNRKGHSSVVVGSAMLVYGGFVDLKGSSQDFWSLDFGDFRLPQQTHKRPSCNCLFVCDRLDDVVPPEWPSARLGGSRLQTRSLSHRPPELHVPVWGFERLTGAERLVEVEFHQLHMDVAQKQVGDVVARLGWMGWDGENMEVPRKAEEI